jgi:hypothetical protein
MATSFVLQGSETQGRQVDAKPPQTPSQEEGNERTPIHPKFGGG